MFSRLFAWALPEVLPASALPLVAVSVTEAEKTSDAPADPERAVALPLIAVALPLTALALPALVLAEPVLSVALEVTEEPRADELAEPELAPLAPSIVPRTPLTALSPVWPLAVAAPLRSVTLPVFDTPSVMPRLTLPLLLPLFLALPVVRAADGALSMVVVESPMPVPDTLPDAALPLSMLMLAAACVFTLLTAPVVASASAAFVPLVDETPAKMPPVVAAASPPSAVASPLVALALPTLAEALPLCD
jgi:hypothetical protein